MTTARPAGTPAFCVIVTDSRCDALAAAGDLRYVSLPQSEPETRALVELLAGASVTGPGPWRQPIAGGRRVIELEAQR